MVHGPWVDLLQPYLFYKTKGGLPFVTLNTFALREHKMQSIYNNITKIWLKHGLLTQKLPLGDPASNEPATQTSWLALKSLYKHEDICAKLIQLNHDDCNFGYALRCYLLRIFAYVLSYLPCAINLKLLLHCL